MPALGQTDRVCATVGESLWDKRTCTRVQAEELTLPFFATAGDLLSSGEQPKTAQGFPALDII